MGGWAQCSRYMVPPLNTASLRQQRHDSKTEALDITCFFYQDLGQTSQAMPEKPRELCLILAGSSGLHSPTLVTEVSQEGTPPFVFRCGPPRIRCLDGNLPLCNLGIEVAKIALY